MRSGFHLSIIQRSSSGHDRVIWPSHSGLKRAPASLHRPHLLQESVSPANFIWSFTFSSPSCSWTYWIKTPEQLRLSVWQMTTRSFVTYWSTKGPSLSFCVFWISLKAFWYLCMLSVSLETIKIVSIAPVLAILSIPNPYQTHSPGLRSSLPERNTCSKCDSPDWLRHLKRFLLVCLLQKADDLFFFWTL